MILHHVSDIEKRGFLTCPSVGFTDRKIRVLDGHAVPAKRNHLAAMLNVKIVERCSSWVGVCEEFWSW